MIFKIGSFNCLNFGGQSNKNLDAFYNIITKENLDIIALQEIKNKYAFKQFIKHLPNKWKGVCEESVGDYAYIWNSEKFCLAKSEILSSSNPSEYQPRIYKQYKIDKSTGQTELRREPYFARFYPIGGGAPFIEIRIINCHIRFSNGNDNMLNLGAIAMRQNEFDVLTKAIYAKEADKRYGTNRPAYTILLGDYNLNLKSSMRAPYLEEIFEVSDNGNIKRIRTAQSDLTTIKKQTDDEEKFANNYDHFTYDELRFQDTTISCSRINAVEKYYKGEYEKYQKEVSDHVPIIMKLNLKKG